MSRKKFTIGVCVAYIRGYPQKIGRAYENEEGEISFKLETIPAYGWEGWINVFQDDDGSPLPRESIPNEEESQ
jgi:hypothetical protein